jgi:hypothetical protein
VRRLGGDTLLVDADNHLRKLKVARVNESVLIDHPARLWAATAEGLLALSLLTAARLG